MVDSQPTSKMGRVFVGRHHEMAQLVAALDGALSGQGQLVMLAGEPGIGKTRTAQELAVLAEQKGAQVLWGWCYEEAGAPPYWPWVQPLRSYVQQASPEQLIEEMGPGAANIAEIVSELRDKLTGLDTPTVLESEQARFRLFDSITTFLKNAAQRQPLILVLDDLHWADQPSLLLLQFLARELAQTGSSRLLVVGCFRDVELSRKHPLVETLAQLSRSAAGIFQRVLLRGLDQEDTARIIEAAVGIQPTAGLAEALYSHTEGNPFFVTEVSRLLSETGKLAVGHIGTPEGLQIPVGVREVIGQRLNRLTDASNQLLITASVIGREFDFRLLNILSDELSEDQVLQAVDEAVSLNLVEDAPGQMDRFQFTHALIQQTIVEGVTTSRRVRLHARIGEALEELYAGNAEAHSAELAHHFAEAQTSTGPDKLVHYSLLAGERSLDSYAFEDALIHFEKGLVARDISISGTEAAPDEEAAALLFGLARTRSATVERHQLVEVFPILIRAFEFYAEAGNAALAVAAAEFPIATPGVLIPGVAQLMARALTLVPADSLQAGRLLSRYGGILGVAECDYEGAQQALGRAIAIARREGDVRLEVQTLAYAADVSGRHLRTQESLDSALRAIELATIEESPWSDVISRYWTATCLLDKGELNAARRHALVLCDIAEKGSNTRELASLTLVPITRLSCLQGDWKAGREYGDRGLEVTPINPQILEPRVLLDYETEVSAQGKACLERLIDLMYRAGPHQIVAYARGCMTIAAVARITGVPEHLEVAMAAAESVISEQLVMPNHALYTRAGLALIAVQQGDKNSAEEQYPFLLTKRGRMIYTVTSVDRLLGLLCQTIGNFDQAMAHFEDSLAFCRKAGYRPELAWTCCDYADMLLERHDQGERGKTITLLDESLAISTELAMRPLMERVNRIEARLDSGPARLGGLTPRELDVLRQISAGKTNKEIAEELLIGVKTIDTHVSHILHKTKSANRAEAASYAIQQGLI